VTAVHIVRAGEHIGSIAHQYGFENFSPLWDHPQNAKLKAARKDPFLLAPGDELFIPDRVQLVFDRVTQASHDIKVHVDKLTLKLRVLGVDGKPKKNTKVTLRVEPPKTGGRREPEQTVTTDGDGNVSVNVATHVVDASFVVDEVEFPLHIGMLDPIDTDRGVEQRLCNLGYLQRRDDEPDPRELRLAIEDFQSDHELELTGKREDIEAKLEEVHGS
jgi:hypothetical protein